MRWLGAVEGYYGPPLAHGERLALVEWLGTVGFNAYGYAPKDDPFHRARWREPYPADHAAELRELIEVGAAAGVDVALVLSPGLDWRGSVDHDALTHKLEWFAELGATVLGVAWDDVTPGGRDLGTSHGEGVAAAAATIGARVRWVTCPTDYATAQATPYLEGYVAALPDAVEVMWTGPSIVSPWVGAEDAKAMRAALGRPVLFAENFPVNDGAMSGVLHLGPYPARDPALVDATTGVFCNFMSRARASRVGLAAAARFWLDPHGDRTAAWLDALGSVPGIETLARACRSWVGDDGPDPELLAWADAALDGDVRLRDYLHRDPRAGLEAGTAAELAPWLEQWELESHAMQMALLLLASRPARPANLAFAVAELWKRANGGREQLFGVRWAYYPVTAYTDGHLVAQPGALVEGTNLTDRLCALALGRPEA